MGVYVVWIVCGAAALLLLAFCLFQLSIREYFREKRAHLRELMRDDEAGGK